MLSTPHIAVGAAIGIQMKNPLIGIPLAFASHFVLEMIPHWNPHLNTEMKKYGRLGNTTIGVIALDGVLGVITFLAMSRLAPEGSSMTNIFLCSVASITPDIMEVPYFFFKVKHSLLKKWLILQKSIQTDTTLFKGIAVQIITIIGAFMWILNSN